MAHDSRVRHADYTSKSIASGPLTTWWVSCRLCNCECYGRLLPADFPSAMEGHRTKKLEILFHRSHFDWEIGGSSQVWRSDTQHTAHRRGLVSTRRRQNPRQLYFTER